MALYVNNSRRKVKFKLRNKLINAAAAAAMGARAARSRQRTRVLADKEHRGWRTADWRRGARISLSTAYRRGGIGANELDTRCLSSETEKRKGNYTIKFLKYFKYKMFYLYSLLDFEEKRKMSF